MVGGGVGREREKGRHERAGNQLHVMPACHSCLTHNEGRGVEGRKIDRGRKGGGEGYQMKGKVIKPTVILKSCKGHHQKPTEPDQVTTTPHHTSSLTTTQHTTHLPPSRYHTTPHLSLQTHYHHHYHTTRRHTSSPTTINNTSHTSQLCHHTIPHTTTTTHVVSSTPPHPDDHPPTFVRIMDLSAPFYPPPAKPHLGPHTKISLPTYPSSRLISNLREKNQI